MKYFLIALICFISAGFISRPSDIAAPFTVHYSTPYKVDSVPTGVPQLFGSKYYQFKGYVLIDSLLLMPCSDTNMLPTKPSIVFKCSDSSFYFWNRQRWLKILDNTEIYANQGLKKYVDTTGLNRPILRATEDFRIDYPEVYLSTAGSDANNGLTPQTPKLTIAAMNGQLNSVASYRGQALGVIQSNNQYGEMIDLTQNNISIGAYDLTASNYVRPPIVNGADVHNSGWSLVGGTSFTYSKAITLNIGSNFNYDYPLVIEIDTVMEKTAFYTARRMLTAVSTQLAVESTPGSFYYANLTNPVTIFIRPTEGAPGSNRFRYEVATRRNVISTSTGLTGVNVQRLIMLNSGGGYGPFGAATGGGANHPYIARNVLFGAGTHLVVSQGGYIENNAFIGAAQGLFNGSIAGSFYKDNATGVYGVLRRNIFIDQVSAWTAHESPSVSSKLERVQYLGNYVFGNASYSTVAFGSEFVRRLDMASNYIEYVSSAFVSAADTLNVIGNVLRGISNKSNTATTPTRLNYRENIHIFTPPSTGSTRNILESTQTGDSLIIANNIIHSNSPNDQAEAANVLTRTTSAALPTPTSFRYNIIIGQAPTGRYTRVMTADQASTVGVTAGLASDYNVYILLSGAGFQFVLLNPNGGGNPNCFTLTDWQTRSGRDGNSIFIDLSSNQLGLKAIFVDPDNGNWNLTASATANLVRAVGAGVTKPISYYPQRPTYEQVATTILNNDNETAIASAWQNGLAASGGPINAITALTGDVVATGPGSVTAELSNTGVTPNTYTLATVTVDEDGRITSASSGSVPATDTTRFWHYAGNTLGTARNFGALDLNTIKLIMGGDFAGALRASKQLLLGDDSTGATSTMARFVVKSSTALGGISQVGQVSGTQSALNMQNDMIQTVNSQNLIPINVNPAYTPGAFTGASYYFARFTTSVASNNIITSFTNSGSNGGAQVDVSGSGFALSLRANNAGARAWATAGDLGLTPAGTSNGVVLENSHAAGGARWQNGSFHIGTNSAGNARLQISGAYTRANNGVAGVLINETAATITDNSTAGSGTVTLTAVNGLAQQTLAATNASVTYTNAPTLYIANAPAAGTNVTITNPYAIYVAAGRSNFLGGIQFNQGSDATGDTYYRNGSGLLTRLAIGTATQMYRVNSGATAPEWFTGAISNTATLDFPNTAAGTSSDLTIAVTGAADGDAVSIGVPNGSTVSNGCFTAWVSATNTVTIRFTNNDLVAAFDPGSGTFKATVLKF